MYNLNTEIRNSGTKLLKSDCKSNNNFIEIYNNTKSCYVIFRDL